MRLTKGLYGHEFKNTSRLFGLSCGQMRGNDLVHNGGWYNNRGEKLGWGDLSPEDLRKISQELLEGETFVVLSESDSFWSFVTKVGVIGSLCEQQPTAEAPGKQYVAEHARFIIKPNTIYWVDHLQGKLGPMNWKGLAMEAINPEYAEQLLLGS